MFNMERVENKTFTDTLNFKMATLIMKPFKTL